MITETALYNNGITSSSIIITYEHINGAKRLFGGRMAEWADAVAGITARRYAKTEVTTAAMDIDYSAPAFVGDAVTLFGKVVCTGKTSMVVRVDIFKEPINLPMRKIGRAHFIFVSVDENGKPLAVERFVPKSDAEKTAHDYAQDFMTMKKKLRNWKGSTI